MTQRVPWWRRPHMRLSASMLLVLLALGGSLAFWLDLNLRRQQDALWQWQGLALAQYFNPQQPEPLAPESPTLISAARLEVEGQTRGYVYVVLRGTRASLLTMDAVADPLRAAAWRFVPAVLLAAAALMLLAQLRITGPLSRLTTLLSEFRADGQEAGPSTHTPRDEIEEATLAAQALRARVQRQLNQIEDNERQRRELIASISHDLHTPLASIQGYAETLILQQATLTPEQRSRICTR